MADPKGQGIWLEIAEVEYLSDFDGTDTDNNAALVARFAADQEEREARWWKIAHITSEKASAEYDRFLKWIDKGRVLIGKFGYQDGKMQVIAIRTKSSSK